MVGLVLDWNEIGLACADLLRSLWIVDAKKAFSIDLLSYL
jgi:hypothetical protein